MCCVLAHMGSGFYATSPPASYSRQRPAHTQCASQCRHPPPRNAARNPIVDRPDQAAELTRRSLLAVGATLACCQTVPEALSAAEHRDASAAHRIPQLQQQELLPPHQHPSDPNSTDYSQPGPFVIARLPRLEHTCHRLFPACVGTQCLLRCSIFYPRSPPPGRHPPYPLAIFTSGFLVPSSSYTSFAERLASWGWVAVLWDKAESLVEPIDDELSVSMLQEIIDWCGKDPIIGQMACTSHVYLCGHSRGAKVSVLAAGLDSRVSALCLIDPVDNTAWAPLGPGFPSAVQALREFGSRKAVANPQIVPLAVVGSSLGGDCAPKYANYRLFYEACSAPAWQVAVSDAGHFQFLDVQSTMQRAICATGRASDADVRATAQAVMVTWGELMARKDISKDQQMPAFQQAVNCIATSGTDSSYKNL